MMHCIDITAIVLKVIKKNFIYSIKNCNTISDHSLLNTYEE